MVSKPEKRSSERVKLVLFLVFAYGTLCYWLRSVGLSPDSTNYMAAALNWVEHGRMFVWVNWPDFTLNLTSQLYQVQPFGFPLYLSFFVLVFREPLLAAVFAQSAALVILFAGLWRVMRRADISAFFWFLLLLLITAFHGFGTVFGHLWTETLFMGLTLHLLVSLARYHSESRKRDLNLALVLFFFTASIRFVGLFNLGFFIPIFLNKKLKPIFAPVVLAIGLLPNVIWHLRNRLMTGTNFEAHYDWSLTQKAWTALQNIFRSLKFTFAYDRVWLFFVVVALLVTLIWLYRGAIRHRRAEPGVELGIFAAFGCITHFAGLTLIAMFSTIGSLIRPDMEQERLLATIYLLFFLWLIMALRVLPKKAQIAGVLALLLMFGNIQSFYLRGRLRFVPQISYPAEYRLWSHLRDLEPIRRASHFYSDYGFIHQVFSGKLQRILWEGAQEFGEDGAQQAARLRELLSQGSHPFFLVRESSTALIGVLNTQGATVGLRPMGLKGFGFEVYSLP